MGLYFKGRPILEETMLSRLLGIPRRCQILGVTYTCEPFEPTERLWLWVNLETGKAVITGDEGNGWCIPLIVAGSKEEAVKKYIQNPPKARYRDIGEALEALLYGFRKQV